MSTTYQPEAIADLALFMLENAKRHKWVDIAKKYQSHFYADQFLTKARMNYDGGPLVTWPIQHSGHRTTRATGAFDKDTYSIKQLGAKASLNWAFTDSNYTYSLYEEEFNKGRDAIIKYLDMRIHAMWTGYFDHMEERLWMAGSPDDDPKNPAGIPYYITKVGLTSSFGFNGGNHANFPSGPAGIDRTNIKYAGWKNAGATYTEFSDDDLLTKLTECVDKCHFVSPHSFAEDGGGKPSYWLCTVYSVIQQAHRLLKASNDNIGSDLGKYRGVPIFKSIPFRWIPVLDNAESPARDTSEPIYGLDMNNWEVMKRTGWDKRVTKPKPLYDSRTTYAANVDDCTQIKCKNPRTSFILCKA